MTLPPKRSRTRGQKSPATPARSRRASDSTTTTIALPTALWRDVRIRAAHEHSDLRGICIAALRAYLATPLPAKEGE